MGGRGIYGSSNMALLLQNNEGVFAQNFEGFIGPASSSAEFMGSQSVLNFAKGQCSRMRQPMFWPIELGESGNDEMDDVLTHAEKKRRLTAEQVQFLEKSFELENKLEPERKIQLAKDLGLQPRQVAIWFQNRRARWKTKQLEKEFEVLRSNYDKLKNDYDNLVKEKEELQTKVLNLTNILLQKEKNDGKLELLDCNKPAEKFLKIESNIIAEVRQVEKFMTVCKQEDISSANSIVLDSESPHYVDGGYSILIEPTSSSTVFEADQSEHSHVGEVEEVKDCEFLALEDNSGNYDIQVGGQTLWNW